MGNVLIVTDDWSGSASITATNTDSDFPVTNLQKMQPSDLWVTTTNTSSITLDRLVSTAPFNFIALLYSNLTVYSTWQVLASNDPAFPGNPGDYDSGVISAIGSPSLTTPTRRHGFVRPSTANMNFKSEGYTLGGGGGLARQYVNISITNVLASTIQAGRLIIGQAYQATKNYSYGATPFGLIDNSRVGETVGGQRIPLSGQEPWKTCRFTLGLIEKAETYRNIPLIMTTCMASKDVLVVLDPDEATYVERMMFYGTLTQKQTINAPEFEIFETTFEVVELP